MLIPGWTASRIAQARVPGGNVCRNHPLNSEPKDAGLHKPIGRDEQGFLVTTLKQADSADLIRAEAMHRNTLLEMK